LGTGIWNSGHVYDKTRGLFHNCFYFQSQSPRGGIIDSNVMGSFSSLFETSEIEPVLFI
jgi:hypothetical protein